jgi:hypothetical protein
MIEAQLVGLVSVRHGLLACMVRMGGVEAASVGALAQTEVFEIFGQSS